VITIVLVCEARQRSCIDSDLAAHPGFAPSDEHRQSSKSSYTLQKPQAIKPPISLNSIAGLFGGLIVPVFYLVAGLGVSWLDWEPTGWIAFNISGRIGVLAGLVRWLDCWLDCSLDLRCGWVVGWIVAIGWIGEGVAGFLAGLARGW